MIAAKTAIQNKIQEVKKDECTISFLVRTPPLEPWMSRYFFRKRSW